MNTELILILMYINDSRMRSFCIDICKNGTCYNVSCDNCPLFHEPNYLFEIDTTREYIDE